MDQPLFQIRNLVCSYDGTGKALVVPQLDIPKGKLVFLLGASGAGKSTLLETLGLMNNTIASGEVLFYAKAGQAPVDLNDLWNNGAKRKINEIRKKYYSFIFQNTNLMENFTAYENVCLSDMIKQGITQEAVLPGAKELMTKVKLPENEVGLSTLAINLSGGQRQRLAFVRALNTSATVLFGDEPTGNLDNVNANELFELIKNNLGEDKSAIVVSHDIDLALRYADIIVVLSKDVAKGYGEILTENIYRHEHWANSSETEKKSFKDKIRTLFNSGVEKYHLNGQDKEHVNVKVSYRNLFFRKEGKVLLGKRMANLMVLTSILFFTFLALGFANGSLDYLDKKMNSAFVNWVSITIPALKDEGNVRDIQQNLESPANRQKYAYDKVTPYYNNSLRVFDQERGQSYLVSGRTVDMELDSQFVTEFVLREKNYIAGARSGFRSNRDISLIMTEKALKDMHYPANADFIFLDIDVTDTFLPQGQQTKKVKLPVPIRTIVKELPGKYGFIYPVFFFKADMLDKGEVFSPIANSQYMYGFLRGTNVEKSKEFRKSLTKFTENYKLSDFERDSIGITIDEPEFRNDTPGLYGGVRFQVIFNHSSSHAVLDTFWTRMMEDKEMKPYTKDILRVFDYGHASDANVNPHIDQISVYFTKLDYISDFAEFIKRQNEEGESERNFMEIDITKVKEKENFNFLSKVTWIISVLLIIFSTVAISLFIFNLLKMHLMKVRMNLGTFKAIGLGDKETMNIYFLIIASFAVVSSILALLIAAGAGELLNASLVSNIKVEEGIKYFKIMNWVTFATLSFILFIAVMVSWLTIRRIISKSPGDLIYNR